MPPPFDLLSLNLIFPPLLSPIVFKGADLEGMGAFPRLDRLANCWPLLLDIVSVVQDKSWVSPSLEPAVLTWGVAKPVKMKNGDSLVQHNKS